MGHLLWIFFFFLDIGEMKEVVRPKINIDFINHLLTLVLFQIFISFVEYKKRDSEDCAVFK